MSIGIAPRPQRANLTVLHIWPFLDETNVDTVPFSGRILFTVGEVQVLYVQLLVYTNVL